MTDFAERKFEESKIPQGIYCYDENGRCPYWGRDPSRDRQESGFCTFLGINDWDDVPGIPLLWDEIKSCGINEDREND